MNILVINDRKILNSLYRKPVIDRLVSQGHIIENHGTFDSFYILPVLILRLLLGRDGLVLSSNLKTNFFVLMFCRSSKVVVINGLGRMRASWLLRVLFLRLLALRKNTVAILQNYADYRFVRRHAPVVSIEWVPGSGGTRRLVGTAQNGILVQRDNKIALVAPDVNRFLSQCNVVASLSIVGCKNQNGLDRLFHGVNIHLAGVVRQSDIFMTGSIFIQPSGYGEGFPHSLADAIVSEMEIYISNTEFMRYGLSRLGAAKVAVAPDWSRIVLNTSLVDAVSARTVSRQITDICERIE